MDITSDLTRLAIQEIAEQHRWSWDRLAADIGTDTPTLRRWLNQWEPENPEQARAVNRTDHLVGAFLAAYTAPEKVPAGRAGKYQR
jgi:hypothetical protein